MSQFVSKTTGKVWDVVKMKSGYGIRIRGKKKTTLTIQGYRKRQEAEAVLDYFRHLIGVEGDE